jgi:hypothetical protein
MPRVVPQLVHKQKAARTRSRLPLVPVALLARGQSLADPADVSALIDHCYFGRRSGAVDPAASAGIAARAGSDSRLQPVKQEPLKSGATLWPTFPSSSGSRPHHLAPGSCFPRRAGPV